MKRVGTMLLVATLALGLSPVRGQDKKVDTTSELKALDAKLTDAFKARDVKTLAKYTADDYFEIDPRGGIHTKKQFLEHLSKGTAKFEDLKETDVKVRVFGTTAVVTGLLHLKGKVGDKDISGEYRWTRVYHAKRAASGCASTSSTPMSSPRNRDAERIARGGSHRTRGGEHVRRHGSFRSSSGKSFITLDAAGRRRPRSGPPLPTGRRTRVRSALPPAVKS